MLYMFVSSELQQIDKYFKEKQKLTKIPGPQTDLIASRLIPFHNDSFSKSNMHKSTLSLGYEDEKDHKGHTKEGESCLWNSGTERNTIRDKIAIK